MQEVKKEEKKEVKKSVEKKETKKAVEKKATVPVINKSWQEMTIEEQQRLISADNMKKPKKGKK